MLLIVDPRSAVNDAAVLVMNRTLSASLIVLPAANILSMDLLAAAEKISPLHDAEAVPRAVVPVAVVFGGQHFAILRVLVDMQALELPVRAPFATVNVSGITKDHSTHTLLAALVPIALVDVAVGIRHRSLAVPLVGLRIPLASVEG